MNSYRLLAPLFSLSGFAFLLFAIDAWSAQKPESGRRASFWATLVGLGVSAALIPSANGSVLFARQMLIWDGLSFFFAWITLLTLFFVVLMSNTFAEFRGVRLSAYYGLLLICGAGLVFLVSANDFLMVFLGIEMFGIPSFILAGYLRSRERSNEAAIKLFLIGAFSTAMLLYGTAMIYGISGSTSLTQLQANLGALRAMPTLSLMAVFFIIVSFGFKIALVPFHMWVPDVFEGSPKPIAALLSVAPKVAGAAIAMRVFDLILPQSNLGLYGILAVLAALTMTIANIVALQQTNIIRLLAYSSIAHMGYLLMGLVGGNDLGITGVYLYGWVYLFMNLGVFGIVISLAKTLGSDEISAYAGLAKRAPFLAALLTVFLISLAGLPPTAGFVAKFYVFLSAFQSGWIWLVALAAVNSVISVAYYFRIVHQMYFRQATSDAPIALATSERLTLAATSFVTIFLGLAPQYFVTTAQALSVTIKP
jgi:NADH-quinone oxidoreductase subunit N